MKGRDILTAISISSELSLVWMAANPPNSPNFTTKKRGGGKIQKQRYEAKVLQTFIIYKHEQFITHSIH